MSNKRGQLDLDYSILHNTGKRVVKERQAKIVIEVQSLTSQFDSLGIMSKTDHLMMSEQKLCSDLDEFIALNGVRGSSDLEYIDEYRSELLDYYRKYRNIHEEIIAEINQPEHDEHFPQHSKKLEELRLGIRQVDSEKVRLKKEEKNKEVQRIKLEYADREREREERRLERE